MKQNWYDHKEKTSLGYKLLFFVLKVFPASFMRFLAYFVGFFYWLFDRNSRKLSKEYLSTLNSFFPDEKSKPRSTLKHIISFALNLVENLQSWAGKYTFQNVHWQEDDIQDLVNNINSKKGTLFIVSHLGNTHVLRGLASFGESGTENKMNITTITDTKITAGFTKLLQQVNPESEMNVICSTDIGPDTILLLQEKLEQGSVVVIAGDRVSANSDRTIEIPFLGRTAEFPYGVYLLASLLNVPTYFVFGLRHNDLSAKPEYDMFVSKNPVDFDCPRKERQQRIEQTARNFAAKLENLCKKHPYQWYNFYKFWK